MIITTSLIPHGHDAYTVWPFIFAKPGTGKALIEHELVHYREQRACLVLPWLVAYLCSRRFRLAAEVRGYRRQIEMGGISAQYAAQLLARGYRLGITQAEALAALEQRNG